ncbi:Txe/YoeB family addiction module toxin [Geminocystis herdmanii]|uniref:Txe/YoeB family addiction module toxin n=1 Tax=Geminocystis herdmanii TaxID=669359 RepID=UPI000348F9FA|nr:Txe/YoeB family addiction module toxin [Geminocystis herdmanii]
MKKKIVFHSLAFDDFNLWASEDKKIYKKIVNLLKDIDRSPFSGLGKPEPLKYKISGYWSRKITQEHRLVYQVTDTEIIVIACKYHYENI